MQEPEHPLPPAKKPRSRHHRSVQADRSNLDLLRLIRTLRGRLSALSVALVGLFVLASFYTLYFGKAFFLPLVIALLLDRLLAPVVAGLRRLHIPSPLGAALVLVLLILATATSLYYLSGPTRDWIGHAPQDLRRVETEVRALVEPVQRVQAAAQEVQNAAKGAMAQGRQSEPSTVTLEQPSFADTLLGQTQAFLMGALITFFFLYFLLAAGDHFMRTMVHVLPHVRDKRRVVEITHHIDHALSKYLSTVAAINVCLGFAIGFAMVLLDMPNAALWGTMAGVLNFIPYLGPIATGVIIGFVALVSFGTVGQAVLVVTVYTAIHLVESYFVSPFIMGRRLTLNPLFIFLSLIFWGWMWGIAGALIAVPLLVAFKIFCDSVDVLKPVGTFLG